MTDFWELVGKTIAVEANGEGMPTAPLGKELEGGREVKASVSPDTLKLRSLQSQGSQLEAQR